MASQLVIDEQIVELEETIDYTMNTGDIANMSLSKSNYTESFKIPKLSLLAVRLFNGLSIPGDISQTPYLINRVDVLDNYALVYSGTLVLMKSDENYYYATVLNGTYDIFTLMGDKTFADVPEILGWLPIKTLENVIDGMQTTTGPAIFAIANYGGITNISTSTETRINIDCIPVAYNALFLFDSIFRFIGVEKDNTAAVLPNMSSQFYTFPYPPLNENAFGNQYFIGTLPKRDANLPAANNPTDYYSWINTSGSFTTSGGSVICTRAGLYNFTFLNFYAYGQGNVNGTNKSFPVDIILKKNGTQFYNFQASMNGGDTGDDYYANAIQQFNVGDTLTIGVSKTVTVDSGASWNFFHLNAVMNITEVELTDETVQQILGTRLSDYVKEFMFRYGLIGFQDNTGRMSFVPIKNILESPAIDWTTRYVRRIEEIYDIGWNQSNWLRHKYVNENSSYYDKNIQTFNLNVPATRDMIQSKVYVPSQYLGQFDLGGILTANNFINVKGLVTYTVDNSNNVKTENRNFWMEAQLQFIVSSVWGSYTMGGIYALINRYMYVSNTFSNSFSDSEIWDSVSAMVVQPRQHTIELKLSPIDMATLNQSQLYFFQQEAAFYMLNTLRYKNGTTATGTFTKVRR